MYLYGRVLLSVTVSHQETRPRDRSILAPPDRKSTHTLSNTVRKDENRVLSRNTHQTYSVLDKNSNLIKRYLFVMWMDTPTRV